MDVSGLRDIYEECIPYVDVQLALECGVDGNGIEGLRRGFVQAWGRTAFPKGKETFRDTEDVHPRGSRLRLRRDDCPVQQDC